MSRVVYLNEHETQQAAEFQLMKVNFEDSWAPQPGFKPRTFSIAGLHSTTNLKETSLIYHCQDIVIFREVVAR